MKSSLIDLDGPVYVVDHGGSGKPVVLVHGLGGSHLNWHAIAPLLRPLGHVHALDLRGFGRTPPAASASVEANRRLLARFIEHLNAGPAWLVGNSMGGLVSLMLAAHRPDLVERMVLVSPAAPGWDPTRINLRWAIMNLLYLIPGVGRMAISGYERSRSPQQRVEESFSLVAADPARLEPLRAAHVAMAAERTTQPWAVPAFLEAYRTIIRLLPPPRYDRLVRAVTAPTLLIHGRSDQVVPVAAAERLSRLRPDWAFVPLAGVGHVAQMEVPQVVAGHIEDWHRNGSAPPP